MHARSWNRAKYLFSPLAFTLALAATIFVTYRHSLTFRAMLPALRFSPKHLELPLSAEELSNPKMRWVEVAVTPALGRADQPSQFRDSVESPGTLILRFDRDAGRAKELTPARESRRGILYTNVNRSRPGVLPEPVIRELNQSGIYPRARFALLFVGQSPWLIWKSILRETGVLASGLVIALALIAYLRWAVIRAMSSAGSLAIGDRKANNAPPRILVRLVRPSVSVALVFAASWTIYQSTFGRPVIPIESICAVGIGAALSLAGFAHLRR